MFTDFYTGCSREIYAGDTQRPLIKSFAIAVYVPVNVFCADRRIRQFSVRSIASRSLTSEDTAAGHTHGSLPRSFGSLGFLGLKQLSDAVPAAPIVGSLERRVSVPGLQRHGI